MKTPWNRKPQYVEWDLTGDVEKGLGAVIYPSVAPMVVLKELEPVHGTYAEIADAVATWVSSMTGQYRLNEGFERFKALANEMEGEAPPEEGVGYVKPPRG